ncbi:MAG TPA: hypothetical protein VGQ02_02435 [Candidatus Limnocylindrales bacterium]|nr:hypothetical protein [Candidatus Limnocylindrales bacterium]
MTNQLNLAPPHSWWTVKAVAVGMAGGPGLFYRLGPRKPLRDRTGRWVRDAAGRTALEAFGALPLGEMYRRLAEVDATWRATGDDATRAALIAADPQGERRRWQDALRELVDFVTTFGPLGFDWSRTYPVENRDADQALDRGRAPDTTVERTARRWRVVFPSPGFAGARVTQVRTNPAGTWSERIEAGDELLAQDFLGVEPSGPLWNHHDDLRRVLALVATLGEVSPNPHAIRAAAGNMPGLGEYDVRDPGIRDPIDRPWREAMLPPRNVGARLWAPFVEHPARVVWPTLGRLILAEYLSAQLAWMTVEAGIDELNRIRTRLTPRSLLQVIYLQLLEHVEERLHFGVGQCLLCHGPILRTRQSGATQNRAHRGCAAVLRKRRQRERDRVAAENGSTP